MIGDAHPSPQKCQQGAGPASRIAGLAESEPQDDNCEQHENDLSGPYDPVVSRHDVKELSLCEGKVHAIHPSEPKRSSAS